MYLKYEIKKYNLRSILNKTKIYFFEFINQRSTFYTHIYLKYYCNLITKFSLEKCFQTQVTRNTLFNHIYFTNLWKYFRQQKVLIKYILKYSRCLLLMILVYFIHSMFPKSNERWIIVAINIQMRGLSAKKMAAFWTLNWHVSQNFTVTEQLIVYHINCLRKTDN